MRRDRKRRNKRRMQDHLRIDTIKDNHQTQKTQPKIMAKIQTHPLFLQAIKGGPQEWQAARSKIGTTIRFPDHKRPRPWLRDPQKHKSWYTIDADWKAIPQEFKEAMRAPARSRRLTPYLWFKRHYLATIIPPTNGNTLYLSISARRIIEAPKLDPTWAATLAAIALELFPGQTPSPDTIAPLPHRLDTAADSACLQPQPAKINFTWQHQALPPDPATAHPPEWHAKLSAIDEPFTYSITFRQPSWPNDQKAEGTLNPGQSQEIYYDLDSLDPVHWTLKLTSPPLPEVYQEGTDPVPTT